MSNGLTRFPDFGKELRRPFAVHDRCCDCAEFYGGCNAWPESTAFCCADYLRLPDVMPGTCGQVIPPSRMKDRREPSGLRTNRSAGEQESAAKPQTTRQCPCGAPLPKYRQYCDDCRQQNRRESMRQYMRKRRVG